MARKNTTLKDQKTNDPATTAGRIKGVRSRDNAFEFDVLGKKDKLHSYSLKPAASHQIAVVLAAYASGHKLHVAAASDNVVTELRLGERPKVKPAKVKAPKAKVEIVNETNTAAAAPAPSGTAAK